MTNPKGKSIINATGKNQFQIVLNTNRSASLSPMDAPEQHNLNSQGGGDGHNMAVTPCIFSTDSEDNHDEQSQLTSPQKPQDQTKDDEQAGLEIYK